MSLVLPLDEGKIKCIEKIDCIICGASLTQMLPVRSKSAKVTSVDPGLLT